MPKIPAPIKAIAKPIATLAKNVDAYAEHQQAKHIAAQPVTLDDGQEAFDIQGLNL